MSPAPRLTAADIERLRQQLSPRHWAVLRDVARFRLMTGRQLQRLHFGDSPSAARIARRVLLSLTERRVLGRLERQVGGLRAGSSGFVYGVGAAGYRLLHDNEPPHRRLHEVRDGFLQHTLALADLYLALREAERAGRCQLLQLETEPACWRPVDDVAGRDWLKPDLALIAASGDDVLSSYVELDRGTEHRPVLLRKLRQYDLAYQLAPGPADAVFPRVTWLVPNPRRAELLRDLIRRYGSVDGLHVVALSGDAVAVLTGADPINNRKEVT